MPVTVIVLGPVGIERDGTVFRPTSGISRALLGMLATADALGLPDSSLVEAMWPSREEPVSRSALSVTVHRLRRWLEDTAPEVSVERTTNGYALALDDASLDLAEFRRLRTRAAELPVAERTPLLESALALWRGRPLEDAPPDNVDMTIVAGLERERLTAAVDLGEAALAAATPDRAVPAVGALAGAHLLEEPLQVVYIDLLAAGGRQAEAMAAYSAASGALREQLGLDPGQGLRDAHLRVVRQQPAAARPAPARPCQVPAAVADFTGRTLQVEHLVDLLRGDAAEDVVISAVAGMGGIGKTTLAVHVAHRLREVFPDGQLYADLRGAQHDPADPAEVLGRFLRALGVDAGAIPEEHDERAALYRSLLADRHMLVVLDDAADEAQVTPLLPGTGTSRVIATSRARLTALAGVRMLELDALVRGQAVEFLTRILGEERARAEPRAMSELAELCGGLPLALRIAGARLAARPHWRVADYAGRLRGRRRLDELAHGGLSVRAAIDLSYEGLDLQAGRLYRLLGLLEAPQFAAWVPVAMLDAPGSLDAADAAEALERLVDARLVEVTEDGTADAVRYRFHDLVREHARERCLAEDPPEERAAALTRALGGWLALTDTLVHVVNGADNAVITGTAARFGLPEDMVAAVVARGADWLEAERDALISGVRQAGRLEDDELSWELAYRSAVLFQPAHYTDAWQQIIDEAVPVVTAEGNRRGRAVLLERRTELACARRDYALARTTVHEALELFESVGDRHGAGLTLRQLAMINRMTGDYSEAVRTGERAGALLADVGDLAGQAYALMVIGSVHYERGRVETALSVLTQARGVAHQARYANIELQSVYWIGLTLIELGRAEDSLSLFDHVDRVATAAGSRLAGMYAAHGLGCAHAALGRRPEAEASFQTALNLARERDDRLTQARVLHALAELCLRDDPHRARGLLEAALDLATSVSVPLWTGRCLLLLAAAFAAEGDDARARELRRRGDDILRPLHLVEADAPADAR